ncbi:MAG: DNA-binding protein [Saccharolobus sp.]
MYNAVMDTSFLLDWVRYSKNNLIFKIFSLIYLPESVINEIRSERGLLWIAENLENNRLVILPELPNIIQEANYLVTESRRIPIRALDFPESICLVIAKMFDLIVLTENGGAIAAPYFFNNYKNVRVMKAIDVLYELYKVGHISDIKSEITLYSSQTNHKFSEKDLKKHNLI